jgi:hypothetical protein
MTTNRCDINNFMQLDHKRWAHFGHNAHKAISIANRNVWLKAQQNELSLKEEVKTQATPLTILLKIVLHDVSRTSTVNYNHQICTQNTERMGFWQRNWVKWKITWNLPHSGTQCYVGRWVIPACCLKMSDTKHSVMLVGEWYQHAVWKCLTPNTQQHGTISQTNEDLNWSTFTEETLTLCIALLHQHQCSTCLIILYSKPLYDLRHTVNAITNTPYSSPWCVTAKQ